SSHEVACFYCSEYTKVVHEYQVNPATNDVLSFTPRCEIHWKYQCGKCGREVHFGGISWCPVCQVFTCVDCAEEKMIRKEFLVYDYYYDIPCHSCGKLIPALDFAEYRGIHPYQTGALLPDDEVAIWKPDSNSEFRPQEFPHLAWGVERIRSLGKRFFSKRLESLEEHDPKSTWDAMAPHWLTVEEENYHHKYRILPEVYRMLDVKNDERVLDVACGKGDVARHLARDGAKVTGIDISKMLDFAIEEERKEPLGISYMQLNAEELSKHLDGPFDKIVCNMALMDIENYQTVIKQVSHALKEEGVFVFSILHPAFSFPATTGVRVPPDSERNEDSLRVILDYYDERPVLFDLGGDVLPPQTYGLHFQRTISSYFNELAKNDLIILEMSEPKIPKEIVERFPRTAYWDDERRPEFLIVKTIKKSYISASKAT
ncbi:MAG: class I SAM-dependent methyltransferase, partial [Candidatus Thorarchaeota archaeon]